MTMATRTYANLLRGETFATVLLTICGEHFGGEFLDWDPEVIQMEVNAEFQTEISQANYNKLMVAIRMVNTDVFYKSLPDFIDICNTLFNGTFNPGQFDPADAAEVAWGVTEALLIWPPESRDEEPFDAKIVGYIGHVVRAEGIMVPPDVLRLGQIGGEDLWARVQSSYMDDPTMFAAIYDVEKEKTDEINTLVKDRLRALLSQLSSLPLQGNSTENMVQQLLQSLQEAQAEGEKLQPISPSR